MFDAEIGVRLAAAVPDASISSCSVVHELTKFIIQCGKPSIIFGYNREDPTDHVVLALYGGIGVE
ncbi:MAG: hypothetical protein K5821_15335 [Nitrobacter sp.]|uniref:hypothetical protein n=1 Tax=Nitrobacter sp. TaxID=29420 RepID=UPI002631B9E5|nr:hypothetical protein [Nitrobacter sp.]MCV0387757.1 hypothetical protein [Nitrobacter sp.]